MKFPAPLLPGTFIKRSKRFLADVILQDGHPIIAHCPNTGSLKNCLQEGWDVRVSYHDKKSRKLMYTLEMIHNRRCWIGVNTMIPNRIAEEAIRNGTIAELSGYSDITREISYGKNSRIDLYLKKDAEMCYVEVKNVTLVEEDQNYYFPDAVTTRGRKHLSELMAMVQQGHRAVSLFIIQRSDGTVFKPAAHIDPEYAHALGQAHLQGVEILVYRAAVSPEKIEVIESVPWQLS